MRITARGVARRFTYANVMSTFAAVLVLGGGTAYAANTVFSTDIVDGEVKSVDIGANAVKTTHIQNNTVASVDVRDDTLPSGGLGSADLAPGSVGSSEIQDSSVGSSDLGTNSVGFDEVNFGTLPRFTYTKQANTATDTVTAKELTVTCNGANDEVTGGGFVIAASGAGGNVPNVTVARSYAVSSNTWLVRAVATSGTPTWQLTVTANCVS